MKFPYKTGNLYPLDAKKILRGLKGHSELVKEEKPFILLETGMVTEEEQTSYLFRKPKKIIKAYGSDDVDFLYLEIERSLKKGRWIAGWFSYEWGYCLEPKLRPLLKKHSLKSPLVWLGVFEKPEIWLHNEDSPSFFSFPENQVFVDGIDFAVDKSSYIQRIDKIKNFISMGHTYQVNYTMPVSFRLNGEPSDLYLLLRSQQAVSYSAFIRDGDFTVLSFSPELFFRRDGASIKSKPMKGTIRRGKYLSEDIKLSKQLMEDVKNRAENIMIVDLIRNDMGRCAEIGSVHVSELFSVERYETLFQMTSTVVGMLRPEISWKEIFQALFPCGSVTGAPKVRTMEIISELEPHPRSIYTGAIGVIGPQNQTVFNVAIRTVVLNGKKGTIHVGSGVTIDSDPKEEYDECILKAKFFIGANKSFPDFSLIETMLWAKNKGYLLLEKHLKRLLESAQYFNFKLDMNTLKARLSILEKRLFYSGEEKRRLRLLLSRNGKISLSDTSTTPISGNLFELAQERVLSHDVFLYHKTTHRPIYEKGRKKADKRGLFDLVFMNEKGEITEGTISNIFILMDGVLYTPPVECGLLNGTLREKLIEKGTAMERVISPDDLKKATKIYLGNSVRGLVEVYLNEKS